MFEVTEEWIRRNRTAKGGYTKRQTDTIGVQWPLPKGWKAEAVGRMITDQQRETFERDSGGCWEPKEAVRIDLNCPYHEKDEAKALGARWDPAKRVWYIVDVEVLDPFMRWLGTPASSLPAKTTRYNDKRDPAGFVTGPKVAPEHCGCNVLPWEECEHSDSAAMAAMREMLSA